MSQSKVSVSIVSFNKKDLLADCIRSVMGQSYTETEIIVVDNASADGSAGLVREHFPEALLIENRENEFFCKAQNQAIRASSGEYVLVLNNDVVLDREFISKAVEAIELDEKVGSVSGKVLRKDGVTVDTTGLSPGRDRRPVERGYGLPDDGSYETAGYIFGAGGACPLYRRAMLDDTAVEGEFFDEGYGAFYEDLDLALRANRRGWLAYYSPAAVAYHIRGATAQSDNPRGRFFKKDFARLPDRLKAMLLSNRYFTIIKNDSLWDFIRDLPFILFYDIKVWGYVALFSPRAIPLFLRRLGGLATAWRRRRLVRGK